MIINIRHKRSYIISISEKSVIVKPIWTIKWLDVDKGCSRYSREHIRHTDLWRVEAGGQASLNCDIGYEYE